MSSENKQNLSTALSTLKKKQRQKVAAEKRVEKNAHALPKGWIVVGNDRKHRRKSKRAVKILNAIIEEAGRGPGEAGAGSQAPS